MSAMMKEGSKKVRRGSDAITRTTRRLGLAGRGHPSTRVLENGQCIRYRTSADMPTLEYMATVRFFNNLPPSKFARPLILLNLLPR